jgi:hypothetical protein
MVAYDVIVVEDRDMFYIYAPYCNICKVLYTDLFAKRRCFGFVELFFANEFK